MKKIIAMLLALTMAFGLAACGNNTPAETTPEATTTAPESTPAETPAGSTEAAGALDVLNNIFNAYAENEKPNVMGGSGDGVNFGGPGALLDTEALNYQLLVPAEQTGNVTEAASMMFAMNANSLTAGVFKVTGDAVAFAEAMKTAVLGNPWMCGFPELLIIYNVGDYVIMAYGLAGISDSEGNFIVPFQDALKAAYPEATLLVEEVLF